MTHAPAPAARSFPELPGFTFHRSIVGHAYAVNGHRDANGNGTPRYRWTVRQNGIVIGSGNTLKAVKEIAAIALEDTAPASPLAIDTAASEMGARGPRNLLPVQRAILSALAPPGPHLSANTLAEMIGEPLWNVRYLLDGMALGTEPLAVPDQHRGRRTALWSITDAGRSALAGQP